MTSELTLTLLGEYRRMGRAIGVEGASPVTIGGTTDDPAFAITVHRINVDAFNSGEVVVTIHGRGGGKVSIGTYDYSDVADPPQWLVLLVGQEGACLLAEVGAK